jgi:hypothetical protein
MGVVDAVIETVMGKHAIELVLMDGKIDVGKTMPIAKC